MNPVLALEKFGVAFAARTILRDVNLSIPALGCTVLLGPSGTGKSTLVRTLAGLNHANPMFRAWGCATYCGESLGASALRPTLMVQKAHLLMATVQDNMIAKLPQRSSLSRSAQIEQVSEFLASCEQFSLLDQMATPVIELPLHVQRVIAILRQALPQPALLMVDEPTVNLSSEGAQAVIDTVRVLARQRAVLMVSHHLSQTRQVADQVILMADGVVKESASTLDFFERPQTVTAQHYLRTGSCPEFGLGVSVDEADVEDDTKEECANDDVTEPPLVEPGSGGQRSQHLQHLQPSPTAKSSFSGPRGFVWLIDGKLAGTPWPGLLHDTDRDLQALRDVNVTRLISLTETPFDATLAATYGIHCVTVPMPDMQAPSLSQACFLCHEIDRALENSETVAVHCKAGLGRTGTVLALYWLWLWGGQISAAAAIEHVRYRCAAMIQSVEQENFLENFALQVDALQSVHNACRYEI